MKKKVLITCAVVLGVLLAVYLGFAFYFSSHYLFNTKINSVKYAGKTAKRHRYIWMNPLEYSFEL